MEVVSGERPKEEQDSNEQSLVAPPVSPTLKQDPTTCFVFDWDDTILPTSWLERIHVLGGGGPLRPEIQRQLSALCTVCAQTIHLAQSMGVVIMITNSAPGWVDQSCQLFMPQILSLVRSIPIFPKPMHAPLTFKITAFRKECIHYRNLISIGDGDAERAASLRLQAPNERKGPLGASESQRRRVKSVKLLEMPTCQQLLLQHEMLQVRLPDVTAYQGCLDLKARFPGNCTVPNAAKGPPTLVHFGRPPAGAPACAAVSPLTTRPSPFQDEKPQVTASPTRNFPPTVHTPTGAGQLPPLGAKALTPPHSATADVEPRTPGDAAGQTPNLSLGPAERQPQTAASGTGNEEPDAPRAVGGAGIWKVQGVGTARDPRAAIFGSSKKRPVLASVATAGRQQGAWREPAIRGF
jgi:hypothetical protein